MEIINVDEKGMFMIQGEDGAITYTTKPIKEVFESYLLSRLEEEFLP